MFPSGGKQIFPEGKQVGIFFPEFLFAGSSIKRTFSYFRHAFRDGNAVQTAATIKSPMFYFRHAHRNGNAGQTAASTESTTFYFRHALRNDQRFKTDGAMRPVENISWNNYYM